MNCVDNLQGDIIIVEDFLSTYHGACIKYYGKMTSPYPQD